MIKRTDCYSVHEVAVYSKLFSICVIASDCRAYDTARLGYDRMGFTPELCEFLVADNTEGNKFSAFAAVRAFVRSAQGRFILIAHDDVVPLEPAIKLLDQIDRLTSHDNMWGVIGNAGVGCDAGAGSARSIEDPDERHRLGRPFVQVKTLDENVLIIRNGTGITASDDMRGFHFYAFDVCSIARRLGYSSYVVDYMWRHGSHGLIDDEFLNARDRMEQKLRVASPRQLEETMCTVLSSGGCFTRFVSALLSLLMLRDDLKRRKDGHETLLQRAKKRWPVFGPVYSVTAFGRATLKKIRPAVSDFLWRVRYLSRAAGRDLSWWRQNWRSRLVLRDRPGRNKK